MRRLLLPAGLLLAAFGLLFLLQGAGVVRWPAESFMLGRQAWVTRGAIVLIAGLALAWAGGRRAR